jgi:DNA-binding NarL/FixJ family response regulator
VLGTVDTAADGRARLRELQPDLITLDIEMPEVAGVDALVPFRIVRAEDPKCEVTVILGTGFPIYREKFAKASLLGSFAKPLNFDKLVVSLRQYFPELNLTSPRIVCEPCSEMSATEV